MDFIYTTATAPEGGRRTTADLRTHEGHSKQGMAATASSWKVSANTPAMSAALCAVPCRVLLLTHPVWRVLMSEARRKQVGLRLVMGRCRLLWNCSTDQAADAFAVSMRAWNLRNSDDMPGERVERPLLPWEGRWKVWERSGWVTLS